MCLDLGDLAVADRTCRCAVKPPNFVSVTSLSFSDSSHMALGFGSNKTKILSAAEKFVQSGKLQNAIAEYEKILKQDPRDLTVLNTVGDLYARLGRADRTVGRGSRAS